MKIKISRSFSLKRQVKEFEPVEWFCAAECEVEEKEVRKMSTKLAKFCQEEVEKIEQEYLTPPGKVGKFDEYAPANIKEDPFWAKKDLSKVIEPKHKDVGQMDAEMDTIQEIQTN